MSSVVTSCEVTIHSASNIPRMDTFGHADPYFKAYFPASSRAKDNTGERLRSTTLKGATPTWEQTLSFDFRDGRLNAEMPLLLVLWDEDNVADEIIGEATLMLCEPGEKLKASVMHPGTRKPLDGGTTIHFSVKCEYAKYFKNSDGAAVLNGGFAPPIALPAPGGHGGMPPPSVPLPLLGGGGGGGGGPSPRPPLVDLFVALPFATTVDEYKAHVQPLGGYALQPSIEPLLPLLGSLGPVFTKYQIPIGLAQKLVKLGEFDAIDVMVDDSGSMACQTDTVDPATKQPMTRWKEVITRFQEMLELFAHLPTPPILVRFLNRKEVLRIDARRKATDSKEEETPESYLQRATNVLAEYWKKHQPGGGTPAMQLIETSLNNKAYEGKAVLRYFFGDGAPDGQAAEEQGIQALLLTRVDPHRNPFTFFSCTNDDSQTAWMKRCEEAAPFVAEYDDYADEAVEVAKDQGNALPFSKGIYLVCTLVGAMWPDDLDSMDESVPLTKRALESIMGYAMPPQQYGHYFSTFLMASATASQAQGTKEEKLQYAFATEVWPGLAREFAEAPVASEIPKVQEYWAKLKGN